MISSNDWFQVSVVCAGGMNIRRLISFHHSIAKKLQVLLFNLAEISWVLGHAKINEEPSIQLVDGS